MKKRILFFCLSLTVFFSSISGQADDTEPLLPEGFVQSDKMSPVNLDNGDWVFFEDDGMWWAGKLHEKNDHEYEVHRSDGKRLHDLTQIFHRRGSMEFGNGFFKVGDVVIPEGSKNEKATISGINFWNGQILANTRKGPFIEYSPSGLALTNGSLNGIAVGNKVLLGQDRKGEVVAINFAKSTFTIHVEFENYLRLAEGEFDLTQGSLDGIGIGDKFGDLGVVVGINPIKETYTVRGRYRDYAVYPKDVLK